MLNELGYLALSDSRGCMCVMWTAVGLAILLDKKNILPKWLGYYTVWQFVSELVAAPVWIAKSGPFAWDGLMTVWLGMAIYVPWQFIVYVCIYRAIRKQPEHELDNARTARNAMTDRKSVESGKGVSVRVDTGGSRMLKKKKTKRQTS